MELTQLINSISVIQVMGDMQRKDVSGIFYDNRRVMKNSVFVAVKGYKTDGHKFILDAINKGAIAVILEDKNSVPDEIFTHEQVVKIVVKDSRKALAEISNALYKEPSKKLKLIGITGTNGKTTTTYLIKSILENAGFKTGLIGTISNMIGNEKIQASLTTPEANDLNELLARMHNEGCQYAVMEVSSHSLYLNRVHSLTFTGGVFTNITSDHLDFHVTFENYFDAKKKLFDGLSPDSFLLYNYDDYNADRIIKDSKANKYSYGIGPGADFKISNIEFNLEGTSFRLDYLNKTYNIKTGLIGEFNSYNCSAAFAAVLLMGFSPEQAVSGILKAPQVPGRMEVIGSKNKKVIIDYSHTQDSLEKALHALRKISGSKVPIYTVFGCGGDRDKTKRPLMGKVAVELSSKVIVTSDNPRSEDPAAIIDDIIQGMNKNNYEIIVNREEAIKKAVESSESNALILIAGKGHEEYQEIKGIRTHFSDKEIAQKYLMQ